MTLETDAKFEEELTYQLKIDMKNLKCTNAVLKIC